MGIYIHIPFCRKACHYCDFHFSTGMENITEMVDGIRRELILRKDYLKGESVNTIYFGGGTPSLLSSEQIKKLIDTVRHGFTMDNTVEITLEANPDDLSEEKMDSFKSAGINRMSIGIQSFFEEHLRFMNRAHNAEQALAAVKLGTKYFDNITIDLIYGTPGMSDEQWRENLRIAFVSIIYLHTD